VCGRTCHSPPTMTVHIMPYAYLHITTDTHTDQPISIRSWDGLVHESERQADIHDVFD
jgi:hypothetical protein